MNSFELNKVLGAILGTCLFLVAMHIASGAVFTPEAPAKPGYVIEVKAEQPAPGAAAAPAEVPIEQLLASASPQQGQNDAKVCLTCHNFGKGQGNKVGPDLYGVVGRPVASEAGFNYSPQLKAWGGSGTWTFDALNKWIDNPRADVPGTMMTFGGIASEKQRANIIAYLNSNSDSPEPLPKAAEAAPAPASANPPPAASAPPPANAAPPATNSPPAGQSSEQK